jgi:hypothetical protein
LKRRYIRQIPAYSCLLCLNLFGGFKESAEVLPLEVGARQLTSVKVNLSLISEQGTKSHSTQLSVLLLYNETQGSKAGLRIRIHFIRIRHFRQNTDPDPDPIRIQGFN